MSWTQRWVFPPHNRSYCLSSWYALSSFFWRNVCYHIIHWFGFFFVKHMQWLFQNFVCFKREKSLFQEILQMIVVLFAAKVVICFIVCLSLFWCSCIEAPLCNTIVMAVKHVLKRNLTFLTEIFNCFFPILFYHISPIFLELDSIWLGESTSMSPTFFDDGKDVLSNNLHVMGGICKEGCLWDLIVKFSFGWLQNLTSVTFGWIIGHISHCSVIVVNYGINDK